MLNSIHVLAGIAALLVGFVLLLHRLFWHAVQRPLYAIYRFAPIKEKKWLFAVGCILLLFPRHPTIEAIRAVFEKTLKRAIYEGKQSAVCDCGHDYSQHAKSRRGNYLCVYRHPRTDEPCYCDHFTITMRKVRTKRKLNSGAI